MTKGPEARLEAAARRQVQKAGGRLIKLIGERGDPDRLCVLEDGDLFFCEFKRPGAVPTPLQEARLEDYRKRGFRAGWCSSMAEFLALLRG